MEVTTKITIIRCRCTYQSLTFIDIYAVR